MTELSIIYSVPATSSDLEKQSSATPDSIKHSIEMCIRDRYKLAAEKAAELSWLELPKSSEMLFEHGKHSAWLLWPYHKIYFTPSPYPLLAVEQYGDAPSDEAKCVRQRKVFNFSLADLQAYGLIKEVPSKESCL